MTKQITREAPYRAIRNQKDGEYTVGDWRYGYFVSLVAYNKEARSDRIYNGYADMDCGDFYPDWDEVLPNTLCRNTGQKDHDCMPIFEGDIVRYDEEEDHDEDAIGVIRYGISRNITMDGAYNVGFYIEWITPGKRYLRNELAFWTTKRKLVVIGNIIDNAEILEGAE